MRIIEQNLVNALKTGSNWSQSNSQVTQSDTHTRVFLHGNEIATVDKEKKTLELSSCGWYTPTTKSRLNSVLAAYGYTGTRVFQVKGVWYLGETKEGSSEFFDSIKLPLLN